MRFAVGRGFTFDIIRQCIDVEEEPDDEDDKKEEPTVDEDGNLVIDENNTETLEQIISDLGEEANKITTLPAETIKALNLTKVDANTFGALGNLKTVDLSTATGLTSLVLDSTSTITQIKLGKNDTALKTINLAGSNVVSLDAPNCKNVTAVNLAGCTNLQHVDLTSAAITSINLTGCSGITTLKVGSCEIESITGLEACKAVLQELNVKGNKLLSLDLEGFTKLVPASVDLSGQTRSDWVAQKEIKWADFFAAGEKIFKTSDANDTDYSEKVAITKINGEDVADGQVTMDENGNVTFAKTPESFTYEYDSGANGVDNMDVTISGTGSENGTFSGSGGGCVSVSNVLGFALVVLALSITKTRRK